MTVGCFTSISLNYLAKARVLAKSVKRVHPDWHLVLCVTDRCPPEFDLDWTQENFDEVIWAEDILAPNAMQWLFKHDVVEACTGIKGAVLIRMLSQGLDKVLYLDPDTAVFSSLKPLIALLDEYSVILTPHQLKPENSKQAIIDNEICSLAHGTYNLGFIGVKNDAGGNDVARWWGDRLREYCHDNKPEGIFVDQKWCDLLPALFDGVHILRDPGCNVASWNLSNRKIKFELDGRCTVNGSELKFFHFTKLGPIGDAMTRRYAGQNTEVYELWSWYKREVDDHSDPRLPSTWWYYGTFDNGIRIQKPWREIYRGAAELQATYVNPFQTDGRSFYSWLADNGHLSAS